MTKGGEHYTIIGYEVVTYPLNDIIIIVLSLSPPLAICDTLSCQAGEIVIVDLKLKLAARFLRIKQPVTRVDLVTILLCVLHMLPILHMFAVLSTFHGECVSSSA